MAARLFLLLVIAGGLVGFAIQNWSPTIALTFLGIKTMALPLALWVLWAIAVGIFTTLAMNALFAASNYLAVQTFRAQLRQNARQNSSPPDDANRSASYSRSSGSRTATATNPDASWRTWRRDTTDRERPQPEPVRDRRSSQDQLDELMDELDDWETPGSDDWDTDRPDRRRDSTPRSQPTTSANQRDYEKAQSPQSTSQSGSVYSYGYREPQNSGAGRTEAVQDPDRVVDAEYRVIIPPYSPTATDSSADAAVNPSTAEENADDWFEDNKNPDDQSNRP